MIAAEIADLEALIEARPARAGACHAPTGNEMHPNATESRSGWRAACSPQERVAQS
jgi:hypothetical protein